jgi:hypothetical protein
MVELFDKADCAEDFAQEIKKKNREKEILQTYKCSSLVYLRISLTCVATMKSYREGFVS